MSHSNPAPRQTLHIFVSNLKCTFYEKRKYKEDGNESPQPMSPASAPSMLKDNAKDVSPFVAFLSCPKRLVKEERSTWQHLHDFFLPMGELTSKTNDDGTKSRTALGWPRTKKLLGTMEPDWTDAGEIHLKVKSHDKHGVPMNHTGSILYFSAFNAANLDISLIGSHAMNLGMLCSKAGTAQRSQLTARSSVYLKDESMSNMTSFEINEPLLKNGRVTGQISCDIDACWLDDAVSARNLKSMKTDAKQKRHMKRVPTPRR